MKGKSATGKANLTQKVLKNKVMNMHEFWKWLKGFIKENYFWTFI